MKNAKQVTKNLGSPVNYRYPEGRSVGFFIIKNGKSYLFNTNISSKGWDPETESVDLTKPIVYSIADLNIESEPSLREHCVVWTASPKIIGVDYITIGKLISFDKTI